MAERPDLPSRSSRARQSGTATVRSRGPVVDVRGWLGGVRMSTFMMVMLFLVILGVLVLVPTIGTYVGQQQRIAALTEQVVVAQEHVDELKKQRTQWNDKAYVITQARERLYYQQPGEIVYIVDDDLDPATRGGDDTPVSDTVQQAPHDWMASMLRSVTEAGMAKTVAPTGSGAPTPTSTPSGTPSPPAATPEQ